MRTWTLVLSICAHAIAIGAFVVAPIFATTDLPELRRALTFETITPIDIPPAPAAVRPQSVQRTADPSHAPIVEPNEVLPEVPPAYPPTELPVDPGALPGGFSLPDLVVGGDPGAIPEPPPARQPQILRVGGNVQPPKRVLYVEPVYPPLAAASGTQGVVILEAVIDQSGDVREVRVLRGHPLLDSAAVQAVTKWKFTPTLLNGTAVPVVMTVTVGFTLKR